MTTETAARKYEHEHLSLWRDKPFLVYNPHNKPVEDLPYIYGFNNGGGSWLSAVSIAEDGTELGSHWCSSEAYMPHDLGLLVGARPELHTVFKNKYPDGFRTIFIPHHEVESCEGLMNALQKVKEKHNKQTQN